MGGLSLLSVGLYLSLTILGAGGWRVFFAEPARTALFVGTVALGVISLFSHAGITSGAREDRSNRWIFLPLTVLGFLLAFLPAYAERKEFWVMDGEALRWTGVVLFAVGGALRLWPIFVLGERFSGLVAIQPGHRLVTTGVYRWIRHPSYLGLLLYSIGWSLAFRSVVGLLLTALMLIPLLARIRAEERLLLEYFGREYADYQARTWRLIAGVY